jgi:hypothetical protein
MTPASGQVGNGCAARDLNPGPAIKFRFSERRAVRPRESALTVTVTGSAMRWLGKSLTTHPRATWVPLRGYVERGFDGKAVWRAIRTSDVPWGSAKQHSQTQARQCAEGHHQGQWQCAVSSA